MTCSMGESEDSDIEMIAGTISIVDVLSRFEIDQGVKLFVSLSLPYRKLEIWALRKHDLVPGCCTSWCDADLSFHARTPALLLPTCAVLKRADFPVCSL